MGINSIMAIGTVVPWLCHVPSCSAPWMQAPLVHAIHKQDAGMSKKAFTTNQYSAES